MCASRPRRPGLDELGWADLVVGADGASSAVRAARAADFAPTLDPRFCKYMWLGTDLVFDAFKFYIEETPYGVFQAHGYPYSREMSTFIVETNEQTWRRAGLDAVPADSLPPGVSDDASVDFSRELFADALGGHQLFANNSKWINFVTVRNRCWRSGNVVLIGDAAHTAHFSIGSGTKLAMEDAVALAWAFRTYGFDDLPAVLESYEAERRPVVESTQRAAQASLEWFEGISRYVGQERMQFAFNLLTRSRRVTYDNLRLRDEGFVGEVDDRFATAEGFTERPPMFAPLKLRSLELPNRVIVSPMDMYSAVDGMPSDFHLVHLGVALARRRRARLHRDDLRLRYRADHAGVRGDVQARARRRLEADRRLRPRLRRLRDGRAARPLGPQGLDEADVARDRRAARSRQLGGARALAAAVLAAESGAAGDDPGRHR